jgi:hypothetical protein
MLITAELKWLPDNCPVTGFLWKLAHEFRDAWSVLPDSLGAQ